MIWFFKKHTDDELVEKIRNWESHYFEQITDRYLQKISNYVYGILNYNKDIVEDVVHDVFLKVWEKLDTYKWGNFNAWIYKVAHSQAVNYIRKNNVSFVDVESSNQSYEFDNDEVNKDYESKVINDLLSWLDERYKQVLMLYYFEWMSYDQIWEIISKPKNTVWTLISRAKQKLKELAEQNPKYNNIFI